MLTALPIGAPSGARAMPASRRLPREPRLTWVRSVLPAALVILPLQAFSASASATGITDLSSRDWLAPGDGLLTYDRSTGLEWLDLTYTTNKTVSQVEASSYHAASGGDFRWAKESEIISLLGHAGPVNNSITFGDNSNVHALIDLIGETSGSSTAPDPEFWGGFRAAQGVTKDVFYLPPPPARQEYSYGLASATVGENYNNLGKVSRLVEPRGNCCWYDRNSLPTVGAWLVRDVSPEPFPIEIPGGVRTDTAEIVAKVAGLHKTDTGLTIDNYQYGGRSFDFHKSLGKSRADPFTFDESATLASSPPIDITATAKGSFWANLDLNMTASLGSADIDYAGRVLTDYEIGPDGTLTLTPTGFERSSYRFAARGPEFSTSVVADVGGSINADVIIDPVGTGGILDTLKLSDVFPTHFDFGLKQPETIFEKHPFLDGSCVLGTAPECGFQFDGKDIVNLKLSTPNVVEQVAEETGAGEPVPGVGLEDVGVTLSTGPVLDAGVDLDAAAVAITKKFFPPADALTRFSDGIKDALTAIGIEDPPVPTNDFLSFDSGTRSVSTALYDRSGQRQLELPGDDN